jgi:hypothetical protein
VLRDDRLDGRIVRLEAHEAVIALLVQLDVGHRAMHGKMLDQVGLARLWRDVPDVDVRVVGVGAVYLVEGERRGADVLLVLGPADADAPRAQLLALHLADSGLGLLLTAE